MVSDMTPWQIDALDAEKDHNLSITDACDRVILDWLSRGDTKPFYDFVLSGHLPSVRVLQALAYMMMRGDPDCNFDPTKTSDPDLAETFPYALAVNSKRKGRRGNGWKQTRDRHIAKAVAHYMADGSSYDGAISSVREWLESIGIQVSMQTVRDAYDSRPRPSGK